MAARSTSSISAACGTASTSTCSIRGPREFDGDMTSRRLQQRNRATELVAAPHVGIANRGGERLRVETGEPRERRGALLCAETWIDLQPPFGRLVECAHARGVKQRAPALAHRELGGAAEPLRHR